MTGHTHGTTRPGGPTLSAVLVRLLGPVEVVVDGAPRTPAGKRERALVALLALTPGETVATEDVAAGLWGGLVAPGGGAGGAGRAGPGRDRAGAREHGRTVCGWSSTPRTSTPWSSSVWSPRPASRSPPRPSTRSTGPWRCGAGRRCPASRTCRSHARSPSGSRRHASARSRTGSSSCSGSAGHAEAVEELRAATAEHPTRERLWGQLMTALHVQHRSQEALEVYADARAALADELGIEPGEALQRIEAAILQGRRGPPGPRAGGPGRAPRGGPAAGAGHADVRSRRADRLHRAQPGRRRTPGSSR